MLEKIGESCDLIDIMTAKNAFIRDDLCQVVGNKAHMLYINELNKALVDLPVALKILK